MPSIRLVFALITVLSGAIHAWEWHWVNPRPTGNNLIHAFFGDHGRGIAVADNGEVAVTGDSGVTWKLQHAGAAHMPLAAAATLDGGTILAGGAQGLWKSGDGGRIWRRTASGAENFFDVCQAGPEAAFAAGTSGTIARSGDGGETWRTFRLDSLDRGFLGLHCGRNGFVAAVGQEGLAVKSMDSGRTWSPLPIPVTDMLACVAFVDSLRGFAAGEKGQVLDTRDGGNTWSTRTLDSTVFFRNIRVEGPRLTLSGSQGGLWKSGDGGMSWTRCETGTDQYLNRTVSVGEGMEIAIGSAGTVLRTTDDGKTWTNRRQGWNWGINGMVALSASAWTVFGANGLVLGTSNAGDSWKEWHAPSGMNLTAGSFWGRKGLLVGSRGVLLRSENGGETWLETGAPTTSRLLSGIGWFDSATVLAVGDSATLLRSDDAGENWRTLPGIPGLDNHILTAVKTLSGGKGVAIGYRELILSTSDKGNTWDVRGGSGTVNLHALAFFDDSAGMAVGTRGTVLATRDGGRTWIPHSTGFEDELRGVAMVNRDTALAAGELFFRPILRITTDGGGTWTEVPGPSANVYYGMESLGSGKVAVVGGGGTLLTADLGAGSVSLRRRGMADRVGGGLELRRLGASPLVSLTLALPFPGRLSISLHSALGKRSKPVYREALGAGRHSLTLPLVAGRRPVFLWALLRGAEGRTRSWIRRLPD